MLQFLIALPFIVTAVIVGIIYFISGYKKGLWRSLVSLGITVISIILSVIFAKLIATPIANTLVTNFLPDLVGDLFEDVSFISAIIMPIIVNAVTVILSALFFVVILLLLLIVLKLIGNRIRCRYLDLDKYSHKGLRFGGMGVRALDTFLVTMMLLLPIYGTISLFSPVATMAISVAEVEEPEIVETVDAVDNNFCVSLYKAGPGEWVLNSLCKTGNGDSTIDIKKISASVSEIISIYNEFLQAEDMDDKADALLRLAEFMETNVISEEWFHGLISASVDELDKLIDNSNDKNIKNLKKYKDILDIDSEALTDTLLSTMGVVKTAIEDENIVDFLKKNKKDYNALSDDFYKEVGELLNESREIRDAKRLLIESCAENLFIDYANKHADEFFPDDVVTSKDRTKYAKDLAAEFVDDYYRNGKVSNSDKDDEGKAITMLMFETDYKKVRKAFAIHPLFGEDALRDAGIYE